MYYLSLFIGVWLFAARCMTAQPVSDACSHSIELSCPIATPCVFTGLPKLGDYIIGLENNKSNNSFVAISGNLCHVYHRGIGRTSWGEASNKLVRSTVAVFLQTQPSGFVPRVPTQGFLYLVAWNSACVVSSNDVSAIEQIHERLPRGWSTNKDMINLIEQQEQQLSSASGFSFPHRWTFSLLLVGLFFN